MPQAIAVAVISQIAQQLISQVVNQVMQQMQEGQSNDDIMSNAQQTLSDNGVTDPQQQQDALGQVAGELQNLGRTDASNLVSSFAQNLPQLS